MKLKKPHLLTFGALALVMPASADVIYSNLQDIAIPATFDGLYLNVETGAWNTPSNLGAGVTGWDVNPFSGGKAFANSPTFQPVRSGTGSSSPILNLAAGVTVGSSSTYSTFVQGPTGETPGAPGYGGSQMLTGLGGNFTDGTEGYIGFRLNGTNYGSMRVVLTNNTSTPVTPMIKDWAYDDSGSITNSVLKTGDGTTVLSQTNTYTGATNVNVGTLVINGSTSTSSAVTVANGAALGGSGAIGGAVTIQAGGTSPPATALRALPQETLPFSPARPSPRKSTSPPHWASRETSPPPPDH